MKRFVYLIVYLFLGISQVSCMEHMYNKISLSGYFNDYNLKELADAACHGNVNKISELLALGVNVNSKGAEGVSTLMWATSCGNVKGMEALLKHGADPNQHSEYENAVLIASDLDNVAPIKLLVAYGGDVNSKAYDSDRPLNCAMFAALFSKNWDVYYYLLDEAKADIYYKDSPGHGLAEHLALVGRWEKILELFDRGYQPEYNSLHDLANSLEIAVRRNIEGNDSWKAIPKVKSILIQRGITFPTVPLRPDDRKYFFLDKIYETVLLKAVSPEKPSKSWLETGLLKDVASDKPSAEWLDSGLQQKFSEDRTYHENGERRFETNNSPEEFINFSIVTGKDGNTIKKMMIMLPSADFYQKRTNRDLPFEFNKAITFVDYAKSIDYRPLNNYPDNVDRIKISSLIDGRVYFGEVFNLDDRIKFIFFEFK